MRQSTTADFSVNVSTDANTERALALLRNICAKGHHWVIEQQTGHRVCGWCDFCEGGCR